MFHALPCPAGQGRHFEQNSGYDDAVDRAGWRVADTVVTNIGRTTHGADTGIDGAFTAALIIVCRMTAVLLYL